MDPQLIGGNDLSQKLQLIGDHHKSFGASVEMSFDFICRKCGTHDEHTHFIPNLHVGI